MALDMSCIELPKPAEPQSADLSWSGIVESIRAHAAAQPPELARELAQWAELVEGIAELQARTRTR